MNVTTFTYQIEGQGITTFGAFKVSNPASSKEMMSDVETKLKELESKLKERGLQFNVTKKIHVSQTPSVQGNEREIPNLDSENLTDHIQKVVAEKFGHSPKKA